MTKNLNYQKIAYDITLMKSLLYLTSCCKEGKEHESLINCLKSNSNFYDKHAFVRGRHILIECPEPICFTSKKEKINLS